MIYQNFNDIIKKAQKNLTCPICDKNYHNDEIKLRGFFDEIYIFQTRCVNHRSPLISIFITALFDKTKIETNFQTNLKTQKTDYEKLRTNIYQQIDQFDGDFEKLWKR